MSVGDIVYWASFGLEKPMAILEVYERTGRNQWAKVIVLSTGTKLDFCLGNLRTWEQMQGW